MSESPKWRPRDVYKHIKRVHPPHRQVTWETCEKYNLDNDWELVDENGEVILQTSAQNMRNINPEDY